MIPKLCLCGCKQETTWNPEKNRYNDWILGHHVNGINGYKKAHRKIIDKICLNCREDFESFESENRVNKKFCSPSCASIYNNKKRGKYRWVELECAFCGTIFEKRKCGVEYHKTRGFKNFYCSKDCSAKDKKGDKRPNTSKSLKRAYLQEKIIKDKHTNGGFREDLGIYVRSGWEANYARVLNHQNKEWEYEPETFLLNIDGEEVTYTPDFYIKSDEKFVEVKGFWYNELSKKKYETFAKQYNIELIQLDEYTELYKEYHEKINWEGRKYE